jgi:hypothetical protein
MSGADVRVIEVTDRSADVTGIDDHAVTNLTIGTVAGLVKSTNGPVIAIFHQYAIHGKGRTVHSVGQLEDYGLDVNDRSLKLKNGKQRIVTPDGYVIPLQIRDGLAYMDMRCPTEQEMEELPHVVFTSDEFWEPTKLDHEVVPDEWHECMPIPPEFDDLRFNEHGEYNLRVQYHDALQSPYLSPVVYRDLYQYAHERKNRTEDIEDLRPCFGWAPVDVIKRTLEATTQMARNVYRLPMRKHFKSRFPALNVKRRNEPVATDTLYADVPAIDDGSKFAQVFVGRNTLVTDVYGMKSDKEFVNTLEDNIRQ